jgi:hypothetical protein
MLPLTVEVGVHTYSAGQLDQNGIAASVYTPPKDEPGHKHKVYGWHVPSSTEPRGAGGLAERIVTEVELFAPAGFPVGPSDLVDLPDGQYHVIGHPLDYTHGPFAAWPGVVVNLRMVEG